MAAETSWKMTRVNSGQSLKGRGVSLAAYRDLDPGPLCQAARQPEKLLLPAASWASGSQLLGSQLSNT